MSGGSARSRERNRSKRRSTRSGSTAVTPSGRVGRGAATLTDNLLSPTELDDLPHREEVAAVIELVNQHELLLDLLAYSRRHTSGVALLGSLEGQLAQPFGGGQPRREALRRIPIANLIELERAAISDLRRAPDRLRHVVEEAVDRHRGHQSVFAIDFRARADLTDRDVVSDAGQDVLQRAPRRCVVKHLGPRDEGEFEPRSTPHEPLLELELFGLPMTRHESVETIPERVDQETADEIGLGLAHQRTPPPTPERDQPGGRAADLIPSDLTLPLRATQPPRREKTAEVSVPCPILRD